MTTPIVQSISDEQLAELDELTAKLTGDWWVDWDSSYAVTASPSNIQSLIVRLRAAEADAKRYRWLCASAWYVGPEPCGDTEAVSWHDHNETKDGVTEAIDKAIAMERTP
ncbi:hypothetical protein [Pseudomonas aeruginosa]|uniref:Uncharacterized protein n=1 Tax=Pseudomonas fluorescens TaxID=294 RepID=A0A3S4REX2_PSEFL|nr:hypothetical protein [Pseudomonas aeruginosa]VEE45712.1 Uncharacterised protein [Pseudomonas fluorescens]HBN9854790.1 hypothetical protein [Pseudomonas aeruginosa]HBN9880252.1 hypothetical protein [Pseudomonas aeruginosa]